MTPHGTAIRAHRQAQRLSIRALAQLTGLTPGYLSRLERGQIKKPAREKLLRIAEALGVPPADITRGEDVSPTVTQDKPPAEVSESELRRYSPEYVVENGLMPYTSARVLRRKCHLRELHFHNDGGRISFTAEDIRKNALLGAVEPLSA